MKKKLIIVAILLFIFSGCGCKQRWVCIADVDKNSRCRIIQCSEIATICATGKYRLLKNYRTGRAYLYSTDPLTDMKQCCEAAGITPYTVKEE